MTVRIYGYPVSTWTRTAVMACIEKGVDYELTPIAMRSEQHAALHPFRRIPVLEHDDVVIAESLAITGYINEAFDGPELMPTDLAGLTSVRRWQSVCSDYVYRDVVRAIPRHREPTTDELKTATETLENLDAMVGPGPFLLGEQLTLADLYLAPQISNANEKAPETLASCPALREWFQAIAERKSFRDTAYDPASL